MIIAELKGGNKENSENKDNGGNKVKGGKSHVGSDRS